MTAAQLRTDLRDSRARLFAPLRALSEEQFRVTPAGEAWPIAAYLGHLLRVERLFTERAERALREDTPAISSTGAVNEDDPAVAQRLAVPQMIHGLQAVRRQLDALLADCDDAALEHAIVHERRGRMTVAQIAGKMADHEAEHAADVERVAARVPATRSTIIPLEQRP